MVGFLQTVLAGGVLAGWTIPKRSVLPPCEGCAIYVSGRALRVGGDIWLSCRVLRPDGTWLAAAVSHSIAGDSSYVLTADTLRECKMTELIRVGGQTYLVWTYPAGPLPDGFDRYKLVMAHLSERGMGPVTVLADSLDGRFGAASASGVAYVVANRNFYGVSLYKRTLVLRVSSNAIQRLRMPQGEWDSPYVECEDSNTVHVTGWSGYAVQYALTRDGGKTWDQPGIPGRHGGVQQSAVCTLSNGVTVLLWLEDRTGDVWPEAMMSTWLKDGSWSGPVELNGPLRGWIVYPERIHTWRTRVKGRLERLYVAWEEGPEIWGEYQDYLAVFDGNKWSPKQRILSGSTWLGNRTPVVDSRGIVYVFGTDYYEDQHTAIYYTRSTSPITGVEAESDTAGPGSFALLGAYPSPFNESTRVRYTLPRAARVSLRVLDVLGKPVRILAGGQQAAGEHTVRWDGRDDAGQPLPSGVYLIRLEAGGQVATRKVVLVR